MWTSSLKVSRWSHVYPSLSRLYSSSSSHTLITYVFIYKYNSTKITGGGIVDLPFGVSTLDAFAQNCMATKSNLSCLLHPPPALHPTPPAPFPALLFSFMPSHLKPSFLLQLFCLLLMMLDNNFSCKLLCVHVNLFVCVCIHFLRPAPCISANHLLAAFFLLSSFCQFLLLCKSSFARRWKDCLDVLCNDADHSGAEVPCVKSTSSKTVVDLMLWFSVPFACVDGAH